ncbi:MAG: hypothetical protein CL608_21230 [Anaerolineaceae bacterium]|nr:hypothetical protein [Anaerolineaceae bacterium]
MTLKKFGRYEIVKELGQGGMAEVYEAHDPLMDRFVALKIIRKNFSQDPHFHDRFWREAKTIANLEHRAIVPVHDFGADEPSGQLYLVMRLMPDVLNKRLTRDGAMSLGDTSLILNRLAAALNTAHNRGIMHRDIKPANILLDDEGTVFLADFGLAAAIDKIESGAVPVAYGGSMFYMAPEQWQDKPLGQYTDVYQLGVTLFEMLTGQRPFPEADGHILYDRHVNGRVPNALELNPMLPAKIQPILEKAMAKAPENRYKTVLELAEDVANLLRPKQIKRRYEIKEELQHGRFAIVYLAHDLFEERQVALKIMKQPLVGNQTYRQLFQRERQQILNMPTHESIVPIYDIDLHENKPYIAMKFVDGASLRERFRKERTLPVDKVIEIANSLAQALDALHAAQCVHGDINMGNVLIDSADHCILADFHITAVAELTEAILGQQEPLSYLPYMSPEQWAREPFLPQTDVYQFGVLLFELLSGQRPFTSMSTEKLQEAIEKKRIPKISTLKPALPRQFDDIFAKALAKQPENRYAKASELVLDLSTAWQAYSFNACKQRGDAHYEAKKWDDAIAAYQQALEVSPDSKAVLAALERAERRKQDSGIFYQSRQAIEGKRWNDAAYFLAKASDTPEKREMLDLVQRQIKVEQQYEAGKKAMQQQEWLKAHKLLDETDFLEPNYKNVNLLLGQLAEKIEDCLQQAREAAAQGDYDQALTLLEPLAEQETAVALRQEIAVKQHQDRRWRFWTLPKALRWGGLLTVAIVAVIGWIFYNNILLPKTCLATADPRLHVLNGEDEYLVFHGGSPAPITGELQTLQLWVEWGPENLSESCQQFILEDERVSVFWESGNQNPIELIEEDRWAATITALSPLFEGSDEIVVSLLYDGQPQDFTFKLDFKR